MTFAFEEFFAQFEKESPSKKGELLAPLNEQQKQVVINYNGPCIVSAGPGAGKTKTVVSRAAYMIEDGVKASSILLFTFTRKAAGEIKERIENLIGDAACGVTVSTYHSFCARQLRRFYNYIGLEKSFTIYDDEDKKKILQAIAKTLNTETKITVFATAISRYKDKFINPRQAKENAENSYDEENAEVYEIYQKNLRLNNAVDFDDLIFYMVKILEDYPIVRKEIHHKWQYITADEAQDSSVVDAKLIFLLMNEHTQNLCLVGDADQAIYGFRGANTQNLYGTVNQYTFKHYYLEENYRSTKTIVRGANSLIVYNPSLDEKKVFTSNEEGSKILHLTCDDPAEEASKVAALINGLIQSTAVGKEAFKYKDIAILCRMSYLTRQIEDSLMRLNIRYEIVNGTSFYSRMEIKDIMSYIKFILNPKDLVALERIVNVPKRKIGDKSYDSIKHVLMTEMQSYAIITLKDVLNILDRLIENGGRYKKGLLSFVCAIREINKVIKDGAQPNEVVEKIAKIINYKQYLLDYEESTAEDRYANVEELMNIAGNHVSLDTFLESMTLNETSRDDDNSDSTDKVQLMTMHSSKGLEYRAVIVVGTNDGIIPHWKCESVEEVQEERRLMYVAMTRAKEVLIITHPEFTMRNGSLVKSNPSRFISQISKEYVLKK